MGNYELSFRAEILLEKGAAVLGDIFRYNLQNNVEVDDKTHPMNALYSVAWDAKQDILAANTIEQLHDIEICFNTAKAVLDKMGVNNDGN